MKSSVYFLFFCFLLLISIFYSKFLLSVSIICLFLLSLYQASQTGFKTNFKQFIATPQVAVLSLFFFAILFSGINSENTAEWLHQIKMKLPYLIIPFSLWVFRNVVKQYYVLFHQLFIGVALLSTVPVLYFIINNIEQVTQLLGQGQSIETPVDHIKYSLFIAFSVVSSFVLANRKQIEPPALKISSSAYLLISLYLFIFLHFLAVRSGLAVAYLIGFFAVINEIRMRKKMILAIPLVAIFILIPLSSYIMIPSVKAKFGYMKYDFNQYLKGEGSNYSDSERIHSIQAGIELFSENKWLGTGIGDLQEACNDLLKARLGRETNKYPHNQFIFTLSGMGLLGFILFCMAFFYPWTTFSSQEWLFIFFALLIFVSFWVENTLERSYSIAFFCFFYTAGILCSTKDIPLE